MNESPSSNQSDEERIQLIYGSPGCGDTMMAAMSSGQAAKLSLDEITKHFRTDTVSGLSKEEVERRRKIHGLNEFDVVEETPLWRKYIDQVLYYLHIIGHYRLAH